jgi:hypothetical protein
MKALDRNLPCLAVSLVLRERDGTVLQQRTVYVLRTSNVYSVSCYESYIYVHKNFIGRNKTLSAG